MRTIGLPTAATALVVVALAFASAASAQVFQLYGGGAASTAPALRQIADCYGNQVPLAYQGSILSGVTADDTKVTLPYFVFTGTPSHNCAPAPTGAGPVNPNLTINFIATNTGAALGAFYSHDAAAYFGDTVPGVDPSVYPTVNFANSEYGLSANDVAVYNFGGTEGKAPSAVTVAAPNGVPNPYPNPRNAYGAQIQIPLVLVPLTLAYSAIYKKVADSNGVITSYAFNVRTQNKDGSGGLRLDVPTICAIFNGQITLWSDPALTALNGGQSLKAKTDKGPEFATLPIELVGRVDSAGNTATLYRALAAQCGQGAKGSSYTQGGHNISYTNQYLPAGGKTLPPSLVGATYVTGNPNNGPAGSYTQLGQPGKFTLAKQLAGLASYLGFTVQPGPGQTLLQARLGYLSPDYALPAVLHTGNNTYNLNVVDVVVRGKSIEPTGGAARAAFGAILPPQTDTKGAYVATATNVGLRSAPQDWVEPISTTVTYSNGATSVPTPLADPTNNGALAVYPFVNTSNTNLYTCYASGDTAIQVENFFKYYLNSPTITTASNGLLTQAGLSPLPKPWIVAITQTFLAPTAKSGTLALNLAVSHVGAGAATQCVSVNPGA